METPATASAKQPARSFDAKRLIVTVVLLLITDMAVLFAIPVLSAIFGFFSFGVLPGLTVLQMLNAGRIGGVERLLFSVGISMAFLLLVGLAANFLLPSLGYSAPLSTPSLLASVSVSLTALCVLSGLRSRGRSSVVHLNFAWHQNNLLWPLILPLVLPVLSVLGTHLMDSSGDNWLLLSLFVLVPVYIALLVLLRHRLHECTYPVAIGMISIALLLAWGMTSDYLMGGDVFVEFQTLRMTLANEYWNPAAAGGAVNYALGASLLPAIYSKLLGISGLFVYKAVFLVLAAIIPLATYAISRRFLDPLFSFLASCFLMAQLPFVNLLPRQIRVDIGLVFFSLTLLALLSAHLTVLQRRVLSIFLGLASVVAYYVTPVLLFAIVLALWITSRLTKSRLAEGSLVSGAMVGLFGASLFAWWGQISDTAFTGYVVVLRDLVTGFAQIGADDTEGTWVAGLYQLTGGGFRLTRLILQHLVNAVVSIGVAWAVLKRRQLHVGWDTLTMLVAAWLILAAYLAAPLISSHYGGDRLFIQTLVPLAPAFVCGCLFIAKGRRHLTMVVALTLLLPQFLVSTFTVDQLAGVPASPVLNRDGAGHDTNYIYESEVVGAQWLYDHTQGQLHVGTDFHPSPGIDWLFEFVNPVPLSGTTNREITVEPGVLLGQERQAGSYIFLRHATVVGGWVYYPKTVGGRAPVEHFRHELDRASKLYANGHAEIYR